MKHSTAVFLMFAGLLALVSFGCGSDATQPTDAGGSATSATHDGHEQKDPTMHGEDGGSDMEKMKAELAKLSPEDAASAERQHICPVSGEMLGAMGPPLKVKVNGQEVWICCEGCKDQLLAKPDEYLAKLQKE